MEILAVRVARLIVYFPTDELNPYGRALIPDVTTALVERYGFISYPQKAEDFDWQKGIIYELGRWNDLSIDRLGLYTTGILVDTSASTSASEAILLDALSWAAESFGLTYKPEMMNNKVYVSELIVKCETSLNPALESLANKLSKSVSKMVNQTVSYEPATIALNFDLLLSKPPLAPFRLEKLADVPFSENKYHAIAPVPTEEHIQLLEEFEAALKS
jgi:hypothetical protein